MIIKSTIFASAFSILLFEIPNDTLANHTQKQQTQNQSDIAALFDRAAAKHRKELDNLLLSRAPSRIYLPSSQVSYKDVAEVLSENTNSNLFAGNEAIYPNKAAVLFYSYEQENLQVWLVDANGIQAYHKRNISENQINTAITKLRNSMGVDSLQLTRSPQQRGIRVASRGQKSNLLNRSIAELTEILLPVDFTNKLASIKHLIIVPVLGLGTVPYAVLQPFGDGSFLIDRMSISVAPSLFDVGQSLERWDVSRAFSSPLIVGNPDLPISNEWIFPPLLGAEKEALAVAQAMNSTPLIGKQATKEMILSRVATSSLLYFATHGIASNNNPLSGSFLVLSADQFERGLWTAKEVQETRAIAQIAVLSACQTGLGKVHDAGIIGLARAFQIAGIPRVVMSLWSVDDAATSELMQAFVEHLKQDNNISPAEALRKAMLEVRTQRPAPSQWASFVLFGTPR